MSKSKPQYIQGLAHFVSFFVNLLNIFYDTKRLVFIELKRTKENILSVLIYGLFLAIFLAFAWICLMGIIYLKLAEWSSPIIALALLLVLQLIIVFFLAVLFTYAKRDFYSLSVLRYLQLSPDQDKPEK